MTTDSNGFVGFDQALFIAEKLRAQFVFDMARNQFFGDGNKRTALLMMNGNLIRHGLCPITITKSREVEYRTALIGYYESPETYKKILFDFFKEEQQAMLSRWGYVMSNNSASIIAPTIDIDRAATKRKG